MMTNCALKARARCVLSSAPRVSSKKPRKVSFVSVCEFLCVTNALTRAHGARTAREMTTRKRGRPFFDVGDLLEDDAAVRALPRLAGSGSEQSSPLVDLLTAAGLRVSHQQSPPGVAVYLQPPCTVALEDMAPEHALCWLMFGIAPEQASLERQYLTTIRRPLLARRFATRLCTLRPQHAAAIRAALAPLTAGVAVERGAREGSDGGGSCQRMGDGDGKSVENGPRSATEGEEEDDDERDEEEEERKEARMEVLVRRAVVDAAAAMGASQLQAEREWQVLFASHSSLANACLALVLTATAVHVQDATFMHAPAHTSRSRLTLLLYDRQVHEAQQRPRRFAWLPCLHHVLATPEPAAVGERVCRAFWRELRRKQGYFPPAELTAALTPPLTDWLASCVTLRGGGLLCVRASLAPKRQLCFYLDGAPGAGKSSLVRALLPSLVGAIRRHLHPECHGAFVKQGLNKPLDHLRLEFERRPNNNDLSVAGVLEMAREPLSATEPRLLLLALEEMPPAEQRQAECCDLLAERLKGSCAHNDLITFVSSNYPLEPSAEGALRRCTAFANLRALRVRPVVGAERAALAHSLLTRFLHGVRGGTPDDGGGGGGGGEFKDVEIAINTDVGLGEGDVRPLVRHLRCLAVYVAEALRRAGGGRAAMGGAPHDASVAVQICGVGGCGGEQPATLGESALRIRVTPRGGTDATLASMELAPSRHGSLAPANGQIIHPLSRVLFDKWARGLAGRTAEPTRADCNTDDRGDDCAAMLLLLDHFLCNAIAPAVIVCSDTPDANAQADALLEAVADAPRFRLIRAVDVRSVKMNRSLYDRRDERSLRDEILDLKGDGGVDAVVIELLAPDEAAELQIREMVEDSPSLVAHSVHKRILHKEGLLFIVRVGSTGGTPELRSRSSLVIETRL